MKKDAYTWRFAETILTAIRAGTAPWQKPWTPEALQPATNFSTGHRYRGENAVLLKVLGGNRGYADPRWGGFHQIRRAGGMVRKGETGVPVTVMRASRREEIVDSATGESDVRTRTFFSIQHVFNVEQADGLQLKPLERGVTAWKPNEIVGRIAADADVEIVHVRGPRAFYAPSQDRITLPLHEQFRSRELHDQTLLHELGHATAHPSRLDRPEFKTRRDDTRAYALEELRAEMAAMMAGERLALGFEPMHGQSYLASWAMAIEEDPQEIRRAASDAGRIADWLLRNVEEEADGRESPVAAAA